MADRKYVAAIDQGTTSTRCMIFDHGGNVVAVDQKEHEQVYPKPGWVEHRPGEIWQRAQEVVQGALSKSLVRKEDIVAVGITNQRETTVVWDKRTGEPLYNAIVWQDTRTDQIVNELAKVRRTTKVAIATKTDLATPEQIAEHLLAIQALGDQTGTTWAEIVPVSAVAGDQVQLLADLLVGMLPEGPPLYPDGDLTDAPEESIAAELIREAALEGVRDELPHSIAVVVEEMALREGRPEDKPLLDIHANVFVERQSQKGIVIGHKGSRLREVGTAARKQIEAMFGTPVYLDLHVKVAKDWQRDPRQLRRLGF